MSTHIISGTVSSYYMSDYAGSTFLVSSDGHGGSSIVDPVKAGSPPQGIRAAALRRFVAATARYGAGGACPYAATADPWRTGATALAIAGAGTVRP